MQTLMITQPVQQFPKKLWKVLINEYDIHEGTIGREYGRNGYEHWQARLRVSDSNVDNFFKSQQRGGAHIERQSTDSDIYERKSGNYVRLGEHTEIRRVRFGVLRQWQKDVVKLLKTQSDRQILVVVDRKGNHGKSWLSIHLYEQGKACYISPSSKTIGRDVASGYRGEPIIVIDIPRTMRWTQELYLGLEQIKDGLITDDRYSHKTINCRGQKVLVMTNEQPKLDKLSEDRWVLYDLHEGDL